MMELQNGRPADCAGRLPKEVRCYDFLDRLGIAYQRIDHAPADNMEACEEIDRALDAVICKNLLLCNRQKTAFYLLMLPGDKHFKTSVLSKEIGGLMKQGKKEEAEATKAKVAELADELAHLEQLEEEYAAEIKKRMQVIPQIIDPSVPIGKDDSENVEIERFGEPFVPDFEVPYHVDIMEKLNGIDIDAARRTSGNGFYYLKGDIARLHSACLSMRATS